MDSDTGSSLNFSPSSFIRLITSLSIKVSLQDSFSSTDNLEDLGCCVIDGDGVSGSRSLFDLPFCKGVLWFSMSKE